MGKKLGIFNFLKKKMSNSSFKKQRKNKLSGRTIMEMLCVLCIAVILSIVAVKGWNYFDTRHQANEILEDVLAAQAKATTHKIKKGYTFETWTNIVPATDTKTTYDFQARLAKRKGRPSYVVRPTRNGVPVEVTKDVCEQLLNMKSDNFSVFQLSDNDTVSVEVTKCGPVNSLMFAFTPANISQAAPVSENVAQTSTANACVSNAGCSSYGPGYVCVSGKCVNQGTCSTNAGCNCAPCTNGVCGTRNTTRCCSGVYCSGCTGSNCCSADGMCACTSDDQCRSTYGNGFSCVQDTGATTKHCRIMKCYQSSDCRYERR